MSDTCLYTVRYQVGTYSGTVHIWAEDGEQAIAKCRRNVRRDMTLPMYYESYKIVGVEDE